MFVKNLKCFDFSFSDSTSPDADENDIPVIPRVPSPKQTSTSSEKEPAENTNNSEQQVSDNELPNLEEVTPKMAQASLIGKLIF